MNPIKLSMIRAALIIPLLTVVTFGVSTKAVMESKRDGSLDPFLHSLSIFAQNAALSIQKTIEAEMADPPVPTPVWKNRGQSVTVDGNGVTVVQGGENGQTIRIQRQPTIKVLPPKVYVNSVLQTGTTTTSTTVQQWQAESAAKSAESSKQLQQFTAQTQVDMDAFKAKAAQGAIDFQKQAEIDRANFLKANGITP
jgi:hypothetical protein